MGLKRLAALLFGPSFLLAGCEGLNYNEGSSYPFLQSAQGGADEKLYSTFSGTALPGDLIASGENYSINLISAFVCGFRETIFSVEAFDTSNGGATPCRAVDGPDAARIRGELAIFANAVEQKGAGTVSTNYQESVRGGRLVYYGEDVRKSGQLLNFRNLPLAGPIRYEGGPVNVSLSMVELDQAENEQVRGLLTKLQDLGASSAFYPSSAALSLLNGLGDSLLKENLDDVEFAFQLRLDPAMTVVPTDPKPKVRRSPLREGYIAIVRHENRSQDPQELNQDTISQAFVICAEQGFLGTKKDGCAKVFRQQSWVLIRISKESTEAARENNINQEIDALRASVASLSGDSRTAVLQTLQNAFAAQ
jgi:hypothetical protein